MERNVARPRLREVWNDAINGFDHEVNVDRGFNAVAAKCIANHWADGQVRYEVIVHHVEVHDIRPGIENGFDVLTQSGEIGRQNGWRY